MIWIVRSKIVLPVVVLVTAWDLLRAPDHLLAGEMPDQLVRTVRLLRGRHPRTSTFVPLPASLAEVRQVLLESILLTPRQANIVSLACPQVEVLGAVMEQLWSARFRRPRSPLVVAEGLYGVGLGPVHHVVVCVFRTLVDLGRQG